MYNPPVGRQRIPLQSQQIAAFLKAFVDKIRKPVEDLCPFLLLGTAFLTASILHPRKSLLMGIAGTENFGAETGRGTGINTLTERSVSKTLCSPRQKFLPVK